MNEKKVQKFIMVFFMCTAGTVMLQLAAPMILGLIVNAVSIGIPFAVYYLLIIKKWRIRIIKSSEEKEQSGSGSGAAEEGPDDGNNGQDETYNPVYEWYTRCGRGRIKAISTNIFAHGKNEFWIRTDGVCNIRTPKGYRRAGNLPGYPGAQANTITEYLKQDGFYAVNDGRYIYVSR